MKAFTLVAILAGVLAGPVLACGDGWMGVNLVASPDIKSALRSAYLDGHPGLAGEDVVSQFDATLRELVHEGRPQAGWPQAADHNRETPEQRDIAA